MARLSASLLALALGAVAALGLVACGSGGGANLLPGSTASEINSNLDQVEQLAGAGDCVGAQDAAQAVSVQIEELGGVDEKLKQALREGATRLNEVVAGCEETTPEETVPTIEEAEEPEEDKKEKPEKPKKSKPEKEAGEPEEEETPTTPTLPPQAEGKAKGHEKGDEEAPPAESGGDGGSPSGGVGPGTPAAGD
jgi:outer membrane biosynthesis protein TonB